MPSRKPHIQFYADECFPVPSVTYLKSLGYSIVHAFDYKMVRKSDPAHLKKALQLGRVLITLDRDFIYYGQAKLEGHPGVIVLSTGSAVPKSIERVCEKLLKTISDDFVRGSLVKVTNEKVIKMKQRKRVFEKKI